MFRKNSIILAFDFDYTLLKIHSCGESITFDRIHKSHLSDFIQSKEFKNFIIRGKSADKLKLCVVSYGYKDLINQYLKISGLLPYFSKVLTPADFGLIDGCNVSNKLSGKNIMLDYLSQHYQIPKNKIILIDDDFQNIIMASQAGFQTYHHTQLGLETKDLNGIIDKIAKIDNIY